MKIPELITLKRQKLGESKTEFGKRFGVGYMGVWQWEKGRREAPYSVIYFCLNTQLAYQKCDECNGSGFIKLNSEEVEG